MEAFQYKYDINGADPMVVEFTVVTGTTIDAGDLVEFSSGGLIQRATAGSTRIAGVAVEGIANANAGDQIQVNVGKGAVYKVKYQPGTKTSLAQSDIGVAFDIVTGAKLLNLDDTTGGMLKVVSFNNTEKTAEVLLVNRLLNQ